MTSVPLNGWTEPQELLLRAAVGSADEADQAYAQWRARQDLRDLDGASHRVLPLLMERLGDDPDDEVATQVRRVVRFTWLRTQLLISRAAPAIELLRDAGIPVLLAKGAAVLAHTGWDIQLRPMDDLDIVVHREQAVDAARLLLAAGMEQASLPPDPADTAIYDEIHALGFRDGTGAELDLHWHVLNGSLHRGADAEFWARAQPALLRELPLSVLSREDTLVQIASHGRQLNVQHPLRWAADAVLLLRDAPAFDWELVAATARRHRIAGQLRGALAALARVAPDVLPRRLPAGLRPRPARALPRPARAARVDVTEFVRRTVAPGERPGPSAALGYTKELWALDRARRIPSHAAWVAAGRRPRMARAEPPAVSAAAATVFAFQAGGDGARLTGPGWWSPDDHGTWSRGREAVVDLPLAAGQSGPVAVELALVPYLTAARPSLRVDLFDGSRRVARWSFNGGELHEARRAVQLARGGRTARLRFVLSGRISPAQAGENADARPLGIALRQIVVTP